MTELIVAFLDFAKAPENSIFVSQNTHCFSVTKTTHLMAEKKDTGVDCGNNEKTHAKTPRKECRIT
jgi:hypothetical protein